MTEDQAQKENNDFEQKVAKALANPQNMGEMEGADAIGTVGSADCGDMLRMWVKFREEEGRKVIDKATFQSFGCQTAIAVASMATEILKGKSVEEALTMKGQDMAQDLGSLPPMKIHCAQMVEDALRQALENDGETTIESPAAAAPAQNQPKGNLSESLAAGSGGGKKIVFDNAPKS